MTALGCSGVPTYALTRQAHTHQAHAAHINLAEGSQGHHLPPARHVAMGEALLVEARDAEAAGRVSIASVLFELSNALVGQSPRWPLPCSMPLALPDIDHLGPGTSLYGGFLGCKGLMHIWSRHTVVSVAGCWPPKASHQVLTGSSCCPTLRHSTAWHYLSMHLRCKIACYKQGQAGWLLSPLLSLLCLTGLSVLLDNG